MRTNRHDTLVDDKEICAKLKNENDAKKIKQIVM